MTDRMIILSIDIGNTHTHFGRVSSSRVDRHGVMPSPHLSSEENPLIDWLRTNGSNADGCDGVAFCSVVPTLTKSLIKQLAKAVPDCPVFHLTHQSILGFPFTYPEPATIGQDRLANAVATRLLHGAPAIILDAGTAITCDVLTEESGFEGGIIAPGIDALRRYLHERTALLPTLDGSSPPPGAIGKSTVEAMQIGTTVGFEGMVRAFVDRQTRELQSRGLSGLRIILTGGTARMLSHLDGGDVRHEPDLTLLGLYHAYRLNRTKEEAIRPDDRDQQTSEN